MVVVVEPLSFFVCVLSRLVSSSIRLRSHACGRGLSLLVSFVSASILSFLSLPSLPLSFSLCLSLTLSLSLSCSYLVNTTFSHNDIFDTSYSGISLGWGWSRVVSYAAQNRVLYNRIHDTMKLLVDGGSIYTLGPQPGSEVAYNYCFDQRNLYGTLYHDEGSAYFWTHDNVVQNVPEWLHIWISSIHNITVERCFYDQTYQQNAGTNITLSLNQYVNTTAGEGWPLPAVAIMERAGLCEDLSQQLRSLF